MRKIILFIIAIFYFSAVNSQVKLADILFDNFEYKTAASIYSEENDLTLSQLEKHAFCYFYTNDFQKSIPIFKKILDQNPKDFSVKYHYGIALKSTGRFKAAKKIFNELFAIDSTRKRLQFQIESIDSLIKWDTIKIFKKLVSFEQINSASSEFSPPPPLSACATSTLYWSAIKTLSFFYITRNERHSIFGIHEQTKLVEL